MVGTSRRRDDRERKRIILGSLTLLPTVAFAQQTDLGAFLPTPTDADGILVLSSSPSPTNHIESVFQALSEIISANYPTSTPLNLNLATLTWPPNLVIGDTTFSIHPSHSSHPTTRTSRTIPKPTSSASRSTTSSTSTTPTPTPTWTNTPKSSPTNDVMNGNEPNDNGDRGIAIILGLLIGLIAIGLMVSIFWLLWRRKRATGNFFKPARCSVCSDMKDASRALTPWRVEPTEPSRSWFATKTNYLTPRVGSTEPLCSRDRELAVVNNNEEKIAGVRRLQKTHSNVSLRAALAPELVDAQGVVMPHELPGDGTEALSELDGDSSSTRNGSSLGGWEANPLRTPVLSGAVIRRDASVRHGSPLARYTYINAIENAKNNTAVEIEAASAESSLSDPAELDGKQAGEEDQSEALPPQDNPSWETADDLMLPATTYSPPASQIRHPSPNWRSLYQPAGLHPNRERSLPFEPLLPPGGSPSPNWRNFLSPSPPSQYHHQNPKERTFRERNPLPTSPPRSISPANSSPRSAAWARDGYGSGISPMLPARERQSTSPAVPFSPLWRRGGVPSQRPSPINVVPGSTNSPYREMFGEGGVLMRKDDYDDDDEQQEAHKQRRGERDDSPRSLLSIVRGAAAAAAAADRSSTIHYPSRNEMREFDFDGAVDQSRGKQHDEKNDSGDGWRPGGDEKADGRYELVG